MARKDQNSPATLTSVRLHSRQTNKQKLKVWLHQGLDRSIGCRRSTCTSCRFATCDPSVQDLTGGLLLSHGSFKADRYAILKDPITLFPHPAWPLVDGALLVSKRRSPAPDDLLTFVRPLCRPVGDPKPRGLQGSTGFVVGVVRSLSQV